MFSTDERRGTGRPCGGHLRDGQTDPIIVGQVNGSGVEFVVDGRNRLKACKIAGVEPKLERRQFESDDAVRAFVKSRGMRRDLTKGERAMSLALLYPAEIETGGRGKKGSQSKRAAETAGVSHRHSRSPPSSQARA